MLIFTGIFAFLVYHYVSTTRTTDHSSILVSFVMLLILLYLSYEFWKAGKVLHPSSGWSDAVFAGYRQLSLPLLAQSDEPPFLASNSMMIFAWHMKNHAAFTQVLDLFGQASILNQDNGLPKECTANSDASSNAQLQQDILFWGLCGKLLGTVGHAIYYHYAIRAIQHTPYARVVDYRWSQCLWYFNYWGCAFTDWISSSYSALYAFTVVCSGSSLYSYTDDLGTLVLWPLVSWCISTKGAYDLLSQHPTGYCFCAAKHPDWPRIDVLQDHDENRERNVNNIRRLATEGKLPLSAAEDALK